MRPITADEEAIVIDALNELAGPRPARAEVRNGSPEAQAAAMVQRWEWASIRHWTERKLSKLPAPASREEIVAIVARYALAG